MTNKEKCEKDIEYIQQTHPTFDFQIDEYDFTPETESEGFLSLHLLLSTYIYLGLSVRFDSMVQILIEESDISTGYDLQQIFGVLDDRKYTLTVAEQYALLRLMNDIQIRRLVNCIIPDCDVVSFEQLYQLFSESDFDQFSQGVEKMKYDAAKASRHMQSICLMDEDYEIINQILDAYLSMIRAYDKCDIDANQVHPYGWDEARSTFVREYSLWKAYCHSNTCEILDKNFFDYYDLSDVGYSDPSPEFWEHIMCGIASYRWNLLQWYISTVQYRNKSFPIDEKSWGNNTNSVRCPGRVLCEPLALGVPPTNNIVSENKDAFCSAFAGLCAPNDPDYIRMFFWNESVEGKTLPAEIQWKEQKSLFAAYVHYAYKDRDLPRGAIDKIKKLFTLKGKSISLAQYNSLNYKSHYEDIEDKLKK